MPLTPLVPGQNAAGVAAGLQALCASARSILGPGTTFKAVIDAVDPKASTLVGDVRALLQAADTDPTVTTLLLEVLEGQELTAGSGYSWTVCLCGLLLGKLGTLLQQGVPLAAVLAGLHEALGACKEVLSHAALPVHEVQELYCQHLLQQCWDKAVQAIATGPGACHNDPWSCSGPDPKGCTADLDTCAWASAGQGSPSTFAADPTNNQQQLAHEGAAQERQTHTTGYQAPCKKTQAPSQAQLHELTARLDEQCSTAAQQRHGHQLRAAQGSALGSQQGMVQPLLQDHSTWAAPCGPRHAALKTGSCKVAAARQTAGIDQEEEEDEFNWFLQDNTNIASTAAVDPALATEGHISYPVILASQAGQALLPVPAQALAHVTAPASALVASNTPQRSLPPPLAAAASFVPPAPAPSWAHLHQATTFSHSTGVEEVGEEEEELDWYLRDSSATSAAISSTPTAAAPLAKLPPTHPPALASPAPHQALPPPAPALLSLSAQFQTRASAAASPPAAQASGGANEVPHGWSPNQALPLLLATPHTPPDVHAGDDNDDLSWFFAAEGEDAGGAAKPAVLPKSALVALNSVLAASAIGQADAVSGLTPGHTPEPSGRGNTEPVSFHNVAPGQSGCGDRNPHHCSLNGHKHHVNSNADTVASQAPVLHGDGTDTASRIGVQGAVDSTLLGAQSSGDLAQNNQWAWLTASSGAAASTCKLLQPAAAGTAASPAVTPAPTVGSAVTYQLGHTAAHPFISTTIPGPRSQKPATAATALMPAAPLFAPTINSCVQALPSQLRWAALALCLQHGHTHEMRLALAALAAAGATGGHSAACGLRSARAMTHHLTGVATTHNLADRAGKGGAADGSWQDNGVAAQSSAPAASAAVVRAQVADPAGTSSSREAGGGVGAGEVGGAGRAATGSWSRHVTVRQLPGRPLRLSVVARGACVLLTEDDQQQAAVAQLLSGLAMDSFAPGNMQQSQERGQKRGGIAAAVFIDGPLLLPSAAPMSIRLSSQLQTHMQPQLPMQFLHGACGSAIRVAASTAQRTAWAGDAESRPVVQAVHTQAAQNPDDISGQSPGCNARIQGKQEPNDPHKVDVRTDARTALNAADPANFAAAAATAAAAWLSQQGARLMLCSGAAPSAVCSLLAESHGIVVLPALGVQAVRAAAAACGAPLLGPQPWQQGADGSGSLDGHIQDTGSVSHSIRWWVYDGGRVADGAAGDAASSVRRSTAWGSRSSVRQLQASLLILQPADVGLVKGASGDRQVHIGTDVDSKQAGDSREVADKQATRSGGADAMWPAPAMPSARVTAAVSVYTQSQGCSTGTMPRTQGAHSSLNAAGSAHPVTDWPVPLQPVIVLLHAPLAAAAEASEASLRRCLCRLQSVSGGGSVAPGGGMLELMCAAWLRQQACQDVCSGGPRHHKGRDRAADAAVARRTPGVTPKRGPSHETFNLTSPPDDDSFSETPPAAWQLLNQRLRQQRPAYRLCVLEAVAEAFEDLVLVLLQNLGGSYAQAAQGVAAAQGALRDYNWCTTGERGSRGSGDKLDKLADRAGVATGAGNMFAAYGVSSRMSAMQVWHVQALLHTCGQQGALAEQQGGALQPEGRSGSGAKSISAPTQGERRRFAPGRGPQLEPVGFVGDDPAAREAGLRACASVVDLLLRADVRIVNNAA